MHTKKIVLGAVSALTVGTLALGGAALAAAGPAETQLSQAAASATGSPSTRGTTGDGTGRSRGPGHGTAPGQRTDRIAQHALTGETAVKVTQAAVAKEPAAYLLRVGKTADGTYLAHMMRPDGTRILLTIDGSFTVTAVADAPKLRSKPRSSSGATTSAPSSTPSST